MRSIAILTVLFLFAFGPSSWSDDDDSSAPALDTYNKAVRFYEEKHWEQAKVQWFGKAVGLWIEAPGRAESLLGQAKAAPSAGASLHGALAEKQAPLVPTAGVLFHLTNEKGQAWTSSDGGKTWVAK